MSLLLKKSLVLCLDKVFWIRVREVFSCLVKVFMADNCPSASFFLVSLLHVLKLDCTSSFFTVVLLSCHG